MGPKELYENLKKYLKKDKGNMLKVQSHFGFSSSGTIHHWINNKVVPEKNGVSEKLEAFLKGKV